MASSRAALSTLTTEIFHIVSGAILNVGAPAQPCAVTYLSHPTPELELSTPALRSRDRGGWVGNPVGGGRSRLVVDGAYDMTPTFARPGRPKVHADAAPRPEHRQGQHHAYKAPPHFRILTSAADCYLTEVIAGHSHMQRGPSSRGRFPPRGTPGSGPSSRLLAYALAPDQRFSTGPLLWVATRPVELRRFPPRLLPSSGPCCVSGTCGCQKCHPSLLNWNDPCPMHRANNGPFSMASRVRWASMGSNGA